MKYSLALLTAAATLSAQDLATVLADRVDKQKKNVGLVLGTIDATGPKVIAHGKSGTDRPLDGASVFEIGSISKTFTGLLLADMIERGEVKGDDPVSKYLPESVKVPSRNGREITLLDLSRHTSSLPSFPRGVGASTLRQFGPDQLYAFLAGHELRRDPGEKFEYSNLGAGLLGHALTRRAGKTYDELLRERVFGPLKMTSSSALLRPDQKPRFVQGHDPSLAPTPAYEFDVFAGAGAVLSTADDMLKFGAAQAGLTVTPLRAAMTRQRQMLGPGPTPQMRAGLGVLVIESKGIVWHNGMTSGCTAVLAMNPGAKKAVIVLSNTAQPVDDIGLHAIDPEIPLMKPAAARPEVKVDEKILETYVGSYPLSPQFAITVTRNGARLFVQATNQPKFEVFAESETKFFLKVVEAQVSFTKSGEGAIDGLILHQGGRDQRAPKAK